jgi:hypothetical protein
MARREEGAYPKRSVTDEQRSQSALSTKTLRATVLFEWGVVGSAITDRSGSAQASPPSPIQKPLVAVPFLLFGQALRPMTQNAEAEVQSCLACEVESNKAATG